MKASVFYRIAAVLLLLFAGAHTLGFRQSDPTWGVDALLNAMRSIHFDMLGVNRTALSNKMHKYGLFALDPAAAGPEKEAG